MNIKKFFVASLVALMGFAGSVKAQQDQFDILAPYINEEQEATIAKIQDNIAKAEKFISAAETEEKANSKFLDSDKKGKQKKGEKKTITAKSNRIKAAKMYKGAYTSLYEIYSNVLAGCQFSYPSDKSAADDFVTEAEDFIANADAKLKSYEKLAEKALADKKYATVKADMNTCKKNYETSADLLRQALDLFNKQSEKKSREAADDQNAWNAAVNQNTVASYQAYLNKFPNGKYAAEAKKRIANLQMASKKPRVTTNNPDEGLAYRIQICADKRPWSARQLKRLYKGNLVIDERQSDGYYKYWIGCYRSYQEAQQAQSEMSLKQSFIVCFNEGVQIHVTEAQRLEAEYE